MKMTILLSYAPDSAIMDIWWVTHHLHSTHCYRFEFGLAVRGKDLSRTVPGWGYYSVGQTYKYDCSDVQNMTVAAGQNDRNCDCLHFGRQAR